MKDPIERQDAIDMLNVGAELLRRVLDDADVVGADREKYSWGLGLIESYIDDIEELPSAQPEPSTEIQEILNYLDNTLHPIVSPDNWNVYSELHDMVSKLPSVQPERETGTWIIDSEYPQHCWCSNCNHRFDLFDPKSIHFCPNCGREMKVCVWGSLDEREKE